MLPLNENIYGKMSFAGGGGSEITVESKNITENGTYTAESGKAFSPVVVNVPNPSSGSISITENGTYDVTEKASAVVNVATGYDLEPSANQIKALIRIPNWMKKQLVRFAVESGDGTCTIDWGDGTVDTVTVPHRYVDYAPQYSHTYATSGLYVVTITAINGGRIYTHSTNEFYTLFEIPLITCSSIDCQESIRKGYLTRIVELHFGSNVHITSLSRVANVYVDDKANNNIYYQMSGKTEIILPSGITTIGPYQFASTVGEYVKIPSSVTQINNNAFDASSFSYFDFTDITLVDGALPISIGNSCVFRSITGYIVFATEEIATVAKSATNWSVYANKIKYAAEITAFD